MTEWFDIEYKILFLGLYCCYAIVLLIFLGVTEAVDQACSVKKVFLEISQNSQENTCARVCFLIKLQAAPVSV